MEMVLTRGHGFQTPYHVTSLDPAITFGPSLGCYKDAKTIADIDREIDAKDVATIKNLEERNNYHGCEDDISLDKMDVSTKQS
ncbi:hypothetical protein Goshw_028723 [Gossypium schwendimanii]|uniref:Uncharacterized protein n=1 Tax=Gossypium schwendimanii TaxID=34291 RepID=A0A7J9N371_GOSSC|nr:hypothetical protein [Gossypium schwendimanii]